MSDTLEANEMKFNSFVNKTIILSSRTYFKKQMKIINKERTIVDNENYSAFLQDSINFDSTFSVIDNVEERLQLNSALKSLSDIEQAVIFLLFHEDLSQSEAAEILEIYSKTVSKIKIRAIGKLKDYLKGDANNEK